MVCISIAITITLQSSLRHCQHEKTVKEKGKNSKIYCLQVLQLVPNSSTYVLCKFVVSAIVYSNIMFLAEPT